MPVQTFIVDPLDVCHFVDECPTIWGGIPHSSWPCGCLFSGLAFLELVQNVSQQDATKLTITQTDMMQVVCLMRVA